MADDILDRVRSFATRSDERPEDEPGQPAEQPAETGTAADQGAQHMAISEAQPGAGLEGAGGAEPGRGDGPAATGRSGGGLAPAGVIRACPIPSGAVIFGELTSAFVDGASLLRYLSERRHTGAVVDAGRSRVQVALLHEGEVVGLISVADGTTRRIDMLSLPAPGTDDEHQLTVLTYRPEITLALAQLINTPERFDRMHASFVDLPALLAYLRRERADGAVRVTTADDAGVILLRGGEILGAYTRHLPELDDEEVVWALTQVPDAEVDVCVGPLTLPPVSIPVSSIL
jgi:hypothetical protein